MNPSDIALFSLADHRLAWVHKRQDLLAQNIAKTDTPGWRTRDLQPFARLQMTPVPATPMHLSGTDTSTQGEIQAGERAPDGNAVAVDVELAKVADTDTTQELVGDLYKKYLGLFRTAIGR